MSGFLPVESAPYMTGPVKPSLQDPPPEDDEHQSRAHHLNESLAKFLHTLHLHYYGEPTKKDVQPRVDVFESKTAFAAYVELPGMTRNEVHVEANDHLFHVSFSGVLKQQVNEDPANRIVVGHKNTATTEGGSGEAAASPPAEEAGDAKGGKEARSEVRLHINERRIGHFHRILQLPIGFVDMSAVTAAMTNGLLVITVPKREREATKTDENPRRKVDVGFVLPIPL